MIGLRPILSDSQPKDTKPAVATASAMIKRDIGGVGRYLERADQEERA